MRLLPKPPSDVVLAQEIELAKRNYFTGLSMYMSVCILASYVAYSGTEDIAAVIWLAVMGVLAIICGLVFYRYHASFLIEPRAGLVKLLLIIGVHSLGYTYLIFHFVPVLSFELAMTLAVITLGLAAGSITLTSPLLSAYYTLAYPSIMTLVVTLYYRPEPILSWLSIGSFAMVLGLTWFAITMSATIRRSIENSFQNEALVSKLRSALIQTDEANRAKSVFLASASHDLRQPLHALGLLTETLGGTELNNEQKEIQSHMMSAVDSTRSMLESLLNISKLDAGAILAEPKPFLVQSIFSKLEAELAPTADENELIYRTRETILAAHSDPLIVELILRNLIANAIRYTDDGGLLVACRKRPNNKLSIEVWDTGVGIPSNKIEDMFREFQQLENPERDAKKGFGLGLAIAQGLAKTLDSEIQVHSVPGQGSVFRFELSGSDVSIIEDLPSSNRATNFNGTKVIIIDDDERVRISMHSLMTSWGCECISGESSHEVLDQLDTASKPNIELLLVDYRLREGRTGSEAIDDIRGFYNKKIPAIIITGDTAANRIAEAQSADALLLHKPASTRQLRRMMQSLLAEKS